MAKQCPESIGFIMVGIHNFQQIHRWHFGFCQIPENFPEEIKLTVESLTWQWLVLFQNQKQQYKRLKINKFKLCIYIFFNNICDALRNLVPFVQLKKPMVECY